MPAMTGSPAADHAARTERRRHHHENEYRESSKGFHHQLLSDGDVLPLVAADDFDGWRRL